MKKNISMILLAVGVIFFAGCAPMMSPSVEAITKNDISALKNELSKGVSANYIQGPPYTVYNGFSLVAVALLNDKQDIFKFLVEHGADINKSLEGLSNSEYLSEQNAISKFKLLLDYDMDPSKLLHYSCGQPAVMEMLFLKKANPDGIANDLSPLSTCISKADSLNGTIKYFNSVGIDASPYLKASANYLLSISILIKNGANVNLVKNKGDTSPLGYATAAGNINLVQQLLEKGASVDYSDRNGYTSLILASSRNYTGIVRLLLAKGADVSLRDKTGKNAADWALKSNYMTTYNAIVNFGQVDVAVDKKIVEPKKSVDELKTILASNNRKKLRTFLDEHPEQLDAIEDPKLKLLYTGPSVLRIIDIVALRKANKKDVIIIAKINASQGAYKSFTEDDMAQLEKMGLSDEVVAAMITANTQYQKEQKLLTKQPVAQKVLQQPVMQQQVEQKETTAGDAVVKGVQDAIIQEGTKSLVKHFLPFKF